MTEAADDRNQRGLGATWYIVCAVSLYVVSYPFVQAYAIRFTLHSTIATAETLWTILDVIYWPMDRFFEVVGLAQPVTDLLYWLAAELP